MFPYGRDSLSSWPRDDSTNSKDVTNIIRPGDEEEEEGIATETKDELMFPYGRDSLSSWPRDDNTNSKDVTNIIRMRRRRRRR
jgi:hypothetical protein